MRVAPPIDASTRKPAMQRCSYTSYRDGSWQSNATATAPYRLTRDLQTNAFVKGWAYGKGRFWGLASNFSFYVPAN